jgi:hypothetical protein
MTAGVFSDNAPRNKLWAAVLLQAIRDVSNPKGFGDNDPEEIRRNAKRFFESPDLEEVCELAGVDEALSADTIRAAYRSGVLHKTEFMIMNFVKPANRKARRDENPV